MHFFLLAALLPGLYWSQGVQAAPKLKEAGIERVCVPAGQQEAWKQQGFAAEVFDTAHAEKAVAPGVEYRMDVASATRVPWVDANGWRFLRNPGKEFYYDVPADKAALAAAEAFAYGANAAVHVAGDPADFSAMLRFLKGLGDASMPVLANFGIIDDGSETTAEVLNLMARRNLLFRVVPAPDPKLDLNVRIGSPEYPKADAEDPYSFAQKLRGDLGDAKRLLRIYGSEVVIGHLTGGEGHVRVHLLNYGRRRVEGMRVRVRGAYAHAVIADSGVKDAMLADFGASEGGTEFTIPAISTYAVVDLTK
ncbi:MAG TPA: hypothetical protein VFA33_11340 [Bryobacteraceae bacterium]|nr:hypothetical protein [Bryobacteraceae bacterium]